MKSVENTIIKVDISINDMESLIHIRNYFGENDKTHLEHLAYAVLDRIVKQHQMMT